jgi:hypothetical protein
MIHGVHFRIQMEDLDQHPSPAGTGKMRSRKLFLSGLYLQNPTLT